MEHQLKLIIRLLAIMAKILAFGFHVGAARDETIADIERGLCFTPRAVTVEALAKALGVKAKSLTERWEE